MIEWDQETVEIFLATKPQNIKGSFFFNVPVADSFVLLRVSPESHFAAVETHAGLIMASGNMPCDRITILKDPEGVSADTLMLWGEVGRISITPVGPINPKFVVCFIGTSSQDNPI